MSDNQTFDIVPTPKNNYLPARAEGEIEFKDNDRATLSNAISAASQVMTERQTNYIVKSDDTAITQAKASLIYSVAYAFASALITGGLVLISRSKSSPYTVREQPQIHNNVW